MREDATHTDLAWNTNLTLNLLRHVTPECGNKLSRKIYLKKSKKKPMKNS